METKKSYTPLPGAGEEKGKEYNRKPGNSESNTNVLCPSWASYFITICFPNPIEGCTINSKGYRVVLSELQDLIQCAVITVSACPPPLICQCQGEMGFDLLRALE